MTDKAMLFFVEVPLRLGSFFRLVNSTRHISAGGHVWQACGMTIEVPSEDVAGSLGRLAIGVSNISRIPMAFIENDDAAGEGEILGAEITCWLGRETDADTAVLDAALSWKHIALNADASSDMVSIDCGHPPAFEIGPRERFNRMEFPQMLAQQP